MQQQQTPTELDDRRSRARVLLRNSPGGLVQIHSLPRLYEVIILLLPQTTTEQTWLP